MSANLSKINRITMLVAAISVWSLGGAATSTYAQGPMHEHGSGQQHGSMQPGGGHAGHQHGTAGDINAANAQAAPRPPHGGQVTKMKPLTLEVVYRPQEIRVYVYSSTLHPESVKDTKGEVVMQVRNDARVVRVPLAYVAPPAGSREQDYLAAAVDLSNVRDGDMRVTFNLENLPLPHRPKVAFTQTFALSKVKLQVTVAALGEGDEAAIARQGVCPVSGERLGSMGDTIKVLIGDQPLYLCCKGCLAKVKRNPEAYLRKASQSH